MFFQITGPISLAVGSTLSQYLLINIRIQASKKERIESEVSLEGIQFQSRPEFNEDIHGASFDSIHLTMDTAD